MSPALHARKLAHIGYARGWAAVTFGSSQLELTSVRAEGADVTVVKEATASATPPEAAADAPLQWPYAARSLGQQFDPHEHRVVTAVDGEDVLCQTLRLPATDPAELQQMLDLQIDNITPLPLEEVVYGFEPLDTLDGQTRVLVAIARKATVNERVSALEAAGLQAEVVSVDTLAMFRALSRRNLLPTDDRQNLLVILGATTANVIVYSNGVIQAVRSIVLGANSESVLREELQRTLVAAEAGQPQRTRGTVTFLTRDEPAKLFAERVASELHAESSFLANGAVPSPGLSLCLECVGDRPRPLNLLPDEWRLKRQAAAVRQRLIRGAIAVAIVYAVALAIFLGFLIARNARLHQAEGAIRDRQAKFHEAKELQSALLAMSKQLDTKFSALEVLREVSTLLPDNVKLTSFVYKKDQTVTIKGQAQTTALYLDFQSRLEKSEFFSKVDPERSAAEASGLTKFGLTCTLRSATAAPTVTASAPRRPSP
ncbi:MAG TPA: pilus assembly protein PilM [Verrucomicrobiae bacterium]|nr:pilus assembly protein PilM [Verrucomicrobiae bacterium]